MLATTKPRDNVLTKFSLTHAFTAATDIYVITTYYQSPELVIQARALLGMMVANLAVQLTIILAIYKKKSMMVKFREALISLLFLRPAVDAYRVSTNHEDESTFGNTLAEMICNKGAELATESIPGCI